MNPLVLPQAGIDTNNFKATFRNIEIYYADEFELLDVNVDFNRNHVEIEVSFPKLRIKSIYNVNGRVLILQVDGNGPADGNFSKFRSKISNEINNFL